MTKWLFALAASLSLATAAFAYAPTFAGSEPLEPALEARAQKLGHEIRCTVCQGLSIADSPASMARGEMDKVRQLLREGKSDQEILDYFVDRYGEWALLAPPAHGFNWLVWLGPVALLVGGLGVIAWYATRGSSGAPAKAETTSDKPAATATPSGDDPYLRAIRGEVDR